jgi:hypothetical protein
MTIRAIGGFLVGALLGLAALWPALAGEADVTDVVIRKAADGSYAFDVTLRHADEGWQHYADGYEVLAPDGSSLGVRVLHHPHVEEQPFTRSLSGVAIPDEVAEVRLRARDSVHGYGGREVVVAVPR